MGYLSISRKEGEKIIITVPPSDQEQTIEVRLGSRKSNQTRITFNAPRPIQIRRNEIPPLTEIKYEELPEFNDPQDLDVQS